ncbi:hypothetical protein K493DRAFT_305550 [Basidiobolus meristosporus CBS 931.73]|uniref:Uncharacterized protein n=1 Tax=Basidiobolus meristosporus CBS 931.73 TaxID=1314790 RepID=A0A1Y1XVB4_9FUNG|nr:hypothetical protein K493DRAFT_305550 [Basidiobolus meristosporus CBS 931.73]|eukprot:ORX89701.1 hypothetical protein K493DRAFT_305550 [Basidiobolus meristosporus CBS 931.73]
MASATNTKTTNLKENMISTIFAARLWQISYCSTLFTKASISVTDSSVIGTNSFVPIGWYLWSLYHALTRNFGYLAFIDLVIDRECVLNQAKMSGKIGRRVKDRIQMLNPVEQVIYISSYLELDSFLLYFKNNQARGRTWDLPLRRRTLYPLSYEATSHSVGFMLYPMEVKE